MQQKNSNTNFFADMQSTLKQMMGGLPSYPVDLTSAMETGRKNMQAITEANQRAVQGWQALAQRQTEMVTQFIQDNSGIAAQGLTEATPEAKIALQTEAVKSAYQRSLANSQELAEMVSKCTKDAADVINKRVVASLNEIKAASNTDAE